nr:M61 family metallopeptidase [Pseudopedobacter sp.]
MKKFYLLALFVSATQILFAQNEIEYTLSFENAAHHEAFISMTIPKVPAGAFLLRMSRSSPGRYATHEFGKNVYDIHAYNQDGAEIDIHQIEGDVYEIPKHQEKIKVTYILYGNLVDGTYAAVDTRHAHLNVPASFMWAPTMQQTPIKVKFILPYSWKVATQLKPENGFYTAPNLQYFMDSPIELSNYRTSAWEVTNPNGLKQSLGIVFHGENSDVAYADFESKVKKIVKEEQAVYGELPKYDHGQYRFLIDVLSANNGDGMEHRNSTIITNSGESLDQAEDDVLSTVAHEYFHSWNVERIRPKTIEPFNFEKANMSDGLWFAEGFTQYYGNLALERAGLKSIKEFITTQGAYLNSVLNSPGANKYSPIFMSQRAVFVDAGVAIDQNNNSNIFSSYYIYGDITALALDLTLRHQFGLSLDDYMKAVWKTHGKTEIAYHIGDLEKVLGEVTRSSDFAKDFFKKFVYSSEKADYEKLFENAGFIFQRANANEAWMGDVRLKNDAGKVFISSATIKGTPLYLAGLDAGDAITQLNDTKITSAKDISEFLKSQKPGDIVKISYEHYGAISTANLKLNNNPTINVISFEDGGKEITPLIEKFRKDWLSSKAKD